MEKKSVKKSHKRSAVGTFLKLWIMIFLVCGIGSGFHFSVMMKRVLVGGVCIIIGFVLYPILHSAANTLNALSPRNVAESVKVKAAEAAVVAKKATAGLGNKMDIVKTKAAVYFEAIQSTISPIFDRFASRIDWKAVLKQCVGTLVVAFALIVGFAVLSPSSNIGAIVLLGFAFVVFSGLKDIIRQLRQSQDEEAAENANSSESNNQ